MSPPPILTEGIPPVAVAADPEDTAPHSKGAFQISFTKETFTNYSDYIRQLNLYRSPIWTCCATGSSGLTYEEALESEEKTREEFNAALKKEWQSLALNIIQYNPGTLEHLSEAVLEKISKCFVDGESVIYLDSDGKHSASILSVNDDETVTVLPLDGGTSTRKLEPVTVSKEFVHRSRPAVSKALMKRYIKYVTTPESLSNGARLWILKPEFTELSNPLPENVALMTELSESGRLTGRARQNSEPGVGRGKRRFPMEDNELPANHKIDKKIPQFSTDFSKVPPNLVTPLLSTWYFLFLFADPLNIYPFSLEAFLEALQSSAPSSSPLFYSCVKGLLKCLADERRRHGKDSFNLHCNTYFTPDASLERVKIEFENGHKVNWFDERITTENWLLLLQSYLSDSVDPTFYAILEEMRGGSSPAIGLDSLSFENRYKIIECMASVATTSTPVHSFIEKSGDVEKTLKKDAKDVKKELAAAEKDLFDTDAKIEELETEKQADAQQAKLAKQQLAESSLIISENEENADGRIISQRRRDIDAEQAKARNKQLRKLKESRVGVYKRFKDLSKQYEKLNIAISEACVARLLPLGCDKDHYKYYSFDLAGPTVEASGRLFRQSPIDGSWGWICDPVKLDELLECLNPKGIRESALLNALLEYKEEIVSAMINREKRLGAKKVAKYENLWEK